jgi:SAM-dependent methyltransferase
MTQPSVNTTFDTSLVDLHPNVSFSTTESDPSDAGMSSITQDTSTLAQNSFKQDSSQDTPQPSQSVPPKTSTPVQHIGTQDAYDQWASVYDSDGNMLQSIDDDELNTLLPSLLDQVISTSGPTISILDLGCGTGRNTARLLSHSWPSSSRISVTGLDFSAGMLNLARTKLAPLVNPDKNLSLRLEQCDPFPTTGTFDPSTLHLPPQNAIISTLVLEHIPLASYFSTLSSLLAPQGLALVTNMHNDMGSRSQAGFMNAQGIKVRGESWVYSVQETVREAETQGFEVVQVRERSVQREDVEKGVGKWIGCIVWFGIVLRKKSPE